MDLRAKSAKEKYIGKYKTSAVKLAVSRFHGETSERFPIRSCRRLRRVMVGGEAQAMNEEGHVLRCDLNSEDALMPRLFVLRASI